MPMRQETPHRQKMNGFTLTRSIYMRHVHVKRLSIKRLLS